MFEENVCDIKFDCRIQWEIVLRGKLGLCFLRANIFD
jgi:hypothetical protein